MNRNKAERRILRKKSKVLPCPFCGCIPEFEARCDYKHSERGSWGHYAVRKPCCNQTGSGQTELFFCNNFVKPDFRLWWSMFNRLVDGWNRRAYDY